MDVDGDVFKNRVGTHNVSSVSRCTVADLYWSLSFSWSCQLTQACHVIHHDCHFTAGSGPHLSWTDRPEFVWNAVKSPATSRGIIWLRPNDLFYPSPSVVH